MKRKEVTFAGLLVMVMLAVLGLVSLPLQNINSQTRSAPALPTTTIFTSAAASFEETSSSSPVSSGPVPSAAPLGIANVTVARSPYFWPEGSITNPTTNRIYVTDGTDNVTVVNALNYSVIDRIVLPGSPHSNIAIDPNTNEIFVATWACVNELNVSGSCQAIPPGPPGTSWPYEGIVELNGSSDNVVKTLPFTAEYLAVDSATGILYASSSDDLLSINERSGNLIANDSLGVELTSMSVNPKTDMIYVEACKSIGLSCQGGEILGISGQSNSVVFTVPLDYNFIEGEAVDSATNTLYVVVVQTHMTLLALDGSSGNITYSSDIAACGVGAGGVSLAFNTATNQIYLVASDYLVVVDAANGQASDMLSLPSMWPGNVEASPDGKEIYLTMEVDSEMLGYLFVLPSQLDVTYVNSAMLHPSGGCLP